MESTLFTYIIKANIALAVFTGLYVLFFRQDTFFRQKRIYLLSVVLFSFIYPFFDLSLFTELFHKPYSPVFFFELDTAGFISYSNYQGTGWSYSRKDGALILMTGISLFLIGRILIQFLSIMYLRKNASKRKIADGTTIFLVNRTICPFSFFHWIFLHKKNLQDDGFHEIMAHEKTHAKQLHSVDILLGEFICAVFWWNPFVWLLRRNIKANLEYIADEETLFRKEIDRKSYQYHLLYMTTDKAAAIITNNFNCSLLKKRIMMMNKERTKSKKKLCYLLTIPVIGVFLFLNSTAIFGQKEIPLTEVTVVKYADTEQNDEIYKTVDTPPAFPGGKDALMRFLSENLYFSDDGDAKVPGDGRVIVRFVVDKTGKVKNPVILKSIAPIYDEEAIRVVNAMPLWIPGEYKGEKVDVYFTLPFKFAKEKK